MIPAVLTIAGSDPSGGAGIQADLKTFHQRAVYGMSVITLLTVQNTRGVSRVVTMSPTLVAAQLEAVLEDIPPQAAKTGALGTSEIIELMASHAACFQFPLVVDPVMLSKSGAPLLDRDAARKLAELLLPHACLVTPNLDEACALSGMPYRGMESVREMAKAISDFGPKAVLIKGGHLEGDASDFLFTDGKLHGFPATRIATGHTHGTGCTYSAAIAAELAKGRNLMEAIRLAKLFITHAIKTSPGLGHGKGPVNHFAAG